jgi:hypothetical protein
VSGWSPGKVELWVAFQTILGTSVEQPADVIAIYGELGEHMTGPSVVQAGDLYRVEDTATTTLA